MSLPGPWDKARRHENRTRRASSAQRFNVLLLWVDYRLTWLTCIMNNNNRNLPNCAKLLLNSMRKHFKIKIQSLRFRSFQTEVKHILMDNTTKICKGKTKNIFREIKKLVVCKRTQKSFSIGTPCNLRCFAFRWAYRGWENLLRRFGGKGVQTSICLNTTPLFMNRINLYNFQALGFRRQQHKAWQLLATIWHRDHL